MWWKAQARNGWPISLGEVMAALAASAGLLALSPARSGRLPEVEARWLISLGGVGVGLVALLRPTSVMLVGLAALAAFGAWWLQWRRRALARARETSDYVQRACAELADDLRMGRTPTDAVCAAAEIWEPLSSIAAAAMLHGDVSEALREVAQIRGASGLRDVAAAWQVAHRTGHGLASTLHDVAQLLAARKRQARHVEAELAAARATALIVSGLPFVVLTMGAGLGANPWAVFQGGLGLMLLSAGGGLMFLGWWWLDRLAMKAVAL